MSDDSDEDESPATSLTAPEVPSEIKNLIDQLSSPESGIRAQAAE